VRQALEAAQAVLDVMREDGDKIPQSDIEATAVAS